MPHRSAAWLAAGALALTLVQPAAAAFESAYTDINLDDCLLLEADDFGASWACPGYKGYPVRISEGDLRFLVEYGFNIDAEPPAVSLPPFNDLGPRMEWRLSNQSGRWLPVATIVRYFTDAGDGDKENQVLVVTQLSKGATCHIAYVDATANEDANAKAREAADEMAGSFDCEEDPEIVGEFGAW
ncbi:hypothetical protein [Devosia nitrariae]|uniref:Secreted protein n=1 Tax=Devosia nitrariae TaxID=2071872 RepID=A0ABQ5W2W4_9HYPH|nr:hypothetical protein [Devosia nitrariae]GLQ54425.1 hypothetical protein GCM10010862_16840 [Devosia nitrariae]